MKNIFKKLTTDRLVLTQRDNLVITCEDTVDREFLAIEIEEFCRSRNISVELIRNEIDLTLSVHYSL